MIDKADIITCESYKPLCDYVYKIGDEPKGGLVHVNMEEIPAFLEAIKGRSDKYVVVSSCSDFGLCIQNENPVWYDAGKWVKMMVEPSLGYNGLNIAPRCNLDKCKQSDKYSSKCYAYTAFTFPEIPDNITHWFMTNSSIMKEDRITVIPFGVAANSANDIAEIAEQSRNYEKLPKMYINWVNYTLERMQVKEYYRNLNADNITIIDEAKPYRAYLRDLAMHSIILSPQGNGIDCYRTLEAMYMGSVPVVEISPTTAPMSDLPLLIAKTLYGLRSNEMHSLYKQVKEQDRPLDKIKLSYWKNRFEEARKEL